MLTLLRGLPQRAGVSAGRSVSPPPLTALTTPQVWPCSTRAHSGSEREGLALLPIYRCGNRGIEWQNEPPKVTQGGEGEATSGWSRWILGGMRKPVRPLGMDTVQPKR